MIRIHTIRSLCILQRNLPLARSQSTSAVDIEKIERDSVIELEVVDEGAKLREDKLEKKRNKSRLREADRNIVHDKVPYTDPAHWSHGTLKYQRKLYGRYGKASGVSPALCWPTKQELFERFEYEKVAYPYSILQMIDTAKNARQEKEERILQRQKEISEKMLKLDSWSQELRNKIARKEAEAKDAKERKDRLVEEVRRHFGYAIDPRDEKFKEMLEKKEKEQKKAMKEARKKAKEEKIVTHKLNKNQSSSASHSTENK